MSTVYTIGHGTRSVQEIVELLREHGVRTLVDVRRFPGSRRWPHLGRDNLAQELPKAAVAYEWWEELGGRRSVAPDSRHPAWRNTSFRAYADHMDSPGFRASFKELEAKAAEGSLAVMCSETVWWRCHRRLISDALVLHGHEVIHILGSGKAQQHPLNEAARPGEDGWPIYDKTV